jgi:hypothetical protein
VTQTSATTRAEPDGPVYLIGTSGHPNYGDEFITAAWLRFLAQQRPDTDVWLDCPNPGLSSHLFKDLHPRLRTTNSLWELVFETRGMGTTESEAHVDRGVVHLGTPHYDLGLLDAREARTVHVLGGGYINGAWPHNALLLRAAQRLREVSGARLVTTGLGLGTAPEPDKLREMLGTFDHATVRDVESAKLSGAVQTCDDAFLGLRSLAGVRNVEHVADHSGDVWVCLQSDLVEPEHFDRAVAAVRDALTSPEMAGRTVHYIEAIPGRDHAAYDRLADLIPRENFVPFVRLWREGFPARSGQTWLTSRFHFHMLAAACGAAGTALVVDDGYYRLKHESLVEAGTGWSLTPAGATTITSPTRDAGFRRASAELRRVKTEEAEQLYPAPPPSPVAPPPPAAPDRRAPGLFRRR